jgi:hypothetical protein
MPVGRGGDVTGLDDAPVVGTDTTPTPVPAPDAPVSDYHTISDLAPVLSLNDGWIAGG